MYLGDRGSTKSFHALKQTMHLVDPRGGFLLIKHLVEFADVGASGKAVNLGRMDDEAARSLAGSDIECETEFLQDDSGQGIGRSIDTIEGKP